MLIIQIATCSVAGLVVLGLASYVYYRYVSRSHELHEMKLPNGIVIQHPGGDSGTGLVYKEMFEDKAYFKHGVTLDPKKENFVLDVGANIGLFSLFIATNYPKAKIVGAEPVPLLHAAAVHNNRNYRDRVHIHCLGLSNTEGSASFEADLAFSAGASLFAQEIQAPGKDHGPIAWARAVLLDSKTVGYGWIPPQLVSLYCSLLTVPVLRQVAFAALTPLWVVVLVVLSAKKIVTSVKVQCRLQTLPGLITTEEGTSQLPKQIDLLKIDCEGSEWNVLCSISDAVWPRIQQVVVEIHNLDGRLDKVEKLLRSKGFTNVVIDTEDWEIHKLLDMGTIFATRL